MIFETTEAQLQIAVSFLPGRIADSHVSQVARHLTTAMSLVSERTGLIGKPTALLTRELGEPGALISGYFIFYQFVYRL